MPLMISVLSDESAKSNYMRVGCYKRFIETIFLNFWSGDSEPENVRRYKKKELHSNDYK